MKSMGVLQFFESFRKKKYSTGNGEWIEFKTAWQLQVIDVVHNQLSIP